MFVSLMNEIINEVMRFFVSECYEVVGIDAPQ